MSPDQIIGGIIVTAVGGILVYWFTVGLSGKSTGLTRTTNERAVSTSATSGMIPIPTNSSKAAVAARTEPNPQAPDKDLLEQFEAAKQIGKGSVKITLIQKLIQLSLDKNNLDVAYQMALSLEHWDQYAGTSRTDFPGFMGQDYEGKVKEAKALHDAGRYACAAQIINTIYDRYQR